MVLISIEAMNVLHEPCVNRLWGAIGSVGGAEVPTNATEINPEWKTHYNYILHSHFYDRTRAKEMQREREREQETANIKL